MLSPCRDTGAAWTRRLTSTVSGVALAVSALSVSGANPAAASELSATASERTTSIVVGHLPVKGAAKVAWLDQSTLHLPNGQTIALRGWTTKQATQQSLRLVGRSNRGWLLRDFSQGQYVNLWLWRHGKRTLLRRHSPTEGDTYSYRRADDGSSFVEIYNDGDGESSAGFFDLDGTAIGKVDFDDYATVLDHSGTQAVVNATDTQVVDLSTSPPSVQPLGVQAITVNLTNDLAITTTGGLAGPTSLSAPAAPAWTAPMSWASISPAGTRVVSGDPSNSLRLEVRATTSGDLISAFRVRFVITRTVVWDTDTSFVFVAYADKLGERVAVVRCTVNGTCARVSKVRPAGALSLRAN